MLDPLSALNDRRAHIAVSLVQPGDFRRGSILASFACCSRPNYACMRDAPPGNGPQMQLAHTVQGKSVQQTLSDRTRRSTAERVVPTLRRFQKTCAELVEIKERIQHMPSAEMQDLAAAPEAANREPQDPGRDRDCPWERIKP